MLNFRYHVVSLIAVFLALAVGVIAGTTVIKQSLVDNLRAQRVHDRNVIADERKQNDLLERELDVWDRFGTATLGPLLRDRLRGRAVVVLQSRGAKEAGAVEQALLEAGASFAGRIELSDRWGEALAQPDGPAARQLAAAVGRAASDPGLMARAAASLASRLRVPADRGPGDLLTALGKGGFLRAGDLAAGPFPPAGALFVLVAEGEADDASVLVEMALPLVRGLAAGRLVAVAESLGAPVSLTERITADPELRARVATIDHVDTLPGRYSLIAGMADLAAGRPAPHYGVRRRTSGVVPAP